MVVVVVVVVFCYTRGLISVVLFCFFCPLLVHLLVFLAIAFARIVQRHRKIMKRRLRVKDYIVQDLSLYEDDAEEEEDFQEEGSTLMGGGRRSVPRRSLTTPAPPPPRAPPPPGTPPPPKGRSTHSRADRLHVLRMQRKRGIAHNADARSELSEFM